MQAQSLSTFHNECTEWRESWACFLLLCDLQHSPGHESWACSQRSQRLYACLQSLEQRGGGQSSSSRRAVIDIKAICKHLGFLNLQFEITAQAAWALRPS